MGREKSLIYLLVLVALLALGTAPLWMQRLRRARLLHSIRRTCRIRHYRVTRSRSLPWSRDGKRAYDMVIETGRHCYALCLYPIYHRAGTLALYADGTASQWRKVPVTFCRRGKAQYRRMEYPRRPLLPLREPRTQGQATLIPVLVPVPTCRLVMRVCGTEVTRLESSDEVLGMRLLSGKALLHLLMHPEEEGQRKAPNVTKREIVN